MMAADLICPRDGEVCDACDRDCEDFKKHYFNPDRKITALLIKETKTSFLASINFYPEEKQRIVNLLKRAGVKVVDNLY